MTVQTETKGFTLVELLVAIALTGTITAGLLAVFFSFIQHQVSTQKQRDALATIRFVLSDINREALFGSDYVCNIADSTDELDSTSAIIATKCSCLTFSDQLNRRIKVRHNDVKNIVEKSIQLVSAEGTKCASATEPDTEVWIPLSDDSVAITNLSFEVERRADRQNRIKVAIEATYEFEGEQQQFALQTQITGRIIRPSQTLAREFRIGGDVGSITQFSHFLFGEDEEEQRVCRDEQGRRYDSSICETEQIPIEAEFSEDGLYVLTDTGLVFHLPQTTITEALRVTGTRGTNAPVYIETNTIAEDVERVTGASGSSNCVFCNNDPRGITTLYQGNGEHLYLLGHDGALYKTVASTRAGRLLAGGVRTSTIKLLAMDRRRALTLFRDDTTARKLRLYTPGSQTLEESDFTTALCTEFQYVTTQRCRQLWPDPISQNAAVIQPQTLRDAFSGIPLSFIDRLQVLENAVHIWYTDEQGEHLVSVGTPNTTKARSLVTTGNRRNEGSIDGKMTSGGPFAYGEGLNTYTFPCDKGNNNNEPNSALCRVSDPFTTNRNTFPSADILPLENNDDRIAQHTHFEGNAIGINERGRLLYFTFGRPAPPATAKAYQVQVVHLPTSPTITATNLSRVLCDAEPFNDGVGNGSNQQVSFKYISLPHPTEDMVALIGTSFSSGESDARSEIYLLVPRSATTRVPYTALAERSTVCASPHIERYHLPFDAGLPQFDLIRFTGLLFKDRL